MDVIIPPEIADELIRDRVAISADSRGLLLPGGDELATVLTLAYAAATQITLIVDGPQAARILARRLAFWRERAHEPDDHPYKLEMEGPNGHVEFELTTPPDVDALTHFIETAFRDADDDPV